ncbi:PREDICTED: P2Y purinoceptor 1-like [Nanorana parkeri]|uniref:P2Y purinoceptor 1-like n=1 Tax=Nanorana parkeri TaxID=125878 RepID=UPI0008549F81|nr:PREDICTED: P2Y purinoceptor 1-like [Nanorana parkeri]
MEEDFFETTAMASTLNVSWQCDVNKNFTFLYLSSVYMVVFVVGLLGNACGLWNLCVNRKKWTSLNVFVLNLGIADLLYVVTLPFFVSYYLNGGVWRFGYGFCRLARLSFHINMSASISFLTCVSIQRYLGIVHPMQMMGRLRKLRLSFYVSVLVWVLVIVQISPNLYFTNSAHNSTYCYDSAINDDVELYAPYTMTITATGFLIPFILIVACYSRVLAVLAKNTNVDTDLKSRSVKLVLIILVLFAVCFFPYYIFRNINLLSRLWQLRGRCTQTLRNLYISYQVTRGLASMNSAINPLLYLVTNENFVSKFRQMQKQAWRTLVYLGRRRTTSDIQMLNRETNKEQEDMCEEVVWDIPSV